MKTRTITREIEAREVKSAKLFHIPRTFEISRAIGRVTFMEIIRDKVLYNAFLVAGFLMSLAFFASRLSFVRRDRLIIDFGLAALTVSSLLIAVLMGAPLLAREFDRRTIYVALARPISRFQFLLGKLSGLMAVVFVNALVLSVVYVLILSMVDAGLSWPLITAIYFVFLQAVLAGTIAVFCSTFTTTSISVVLTLGVYMIGTNVSQLRFLSGRVESSLARVSLEGLALILPNFENFVLGTKVTYELPVSSQYVLQATGYAFAWLVVLLVMSAFTVRFKED